MHSSLAADSSRPFCCPAIARQRSQFQPRAPEPAIRLFRKSPACLLLLRYSIRGRRHFMPELPRGTRSHDSQRPISLRPLRDSPRPSDRNTCVRERKSLRITSQALSHNSVPNRQHHIPSIPPVLEFPAPVARFIFSSTPCSPSAGMSTCIFAIAVPEIAPIIAAGSVDARS